MITITFARKKSGSHFPLQLVVIARVSSFTSKEEKNKEHKDRDGRIESFPPSVLCGVCCVCERVPRCAAITSFYHSRSPCYFYFFFFFL